MSASYPRKSAEQRAALRSHRAVRRHGDHTNRCVVKHRIMPDGRRRIMLVPFPGVSKYDRCGARAEVEAAVIA